VTYRLSEHARREIDRRGIPLDLLASVLEEPEQIVSERGKLKAYQSKVEIGGRVFLLRVIVDDSAHPMVVVTAYRTSKIGRYWQTR
jgi:Domain of unknown function (DUF4258)